jgi:hypothetical protein
MTSELPDPDRDVFREYHRVGRARRVRTALVTLAVIVLAAGAVAGISGFANAHRSAPTSVSADVPLTRASFVSTVQSGTPATTTVHATMVITTNGQAVTMEGDESAGKTLSDSAVALKLAIPGRPSAEVRLVDSILYVNAGAATQNKFAVVRLDDATNPIAIAFASFDKAMNPATNVGLLKDSISSVTVAGDAVPLEGIDSVPYDVVVNIAAVKAELGLGAAQMPDRITYRYWVGSDHLIRKFSFTAAGISEVATFEKWGEPVSITAPSEGERTTVVLQN